MGALAVLVGSFRDAADRPVRLGNRGLGTLAKVDLSGLRPVPIEGAVILSDVNNPLLGADGAASVFGPQKGANEAQVLGLESNLRRLGRLVPIAPETPGAGAAGGTGFGLLAWGATIQTGAAVIGEALGLRLPLPGPRSSSRAKDGLMPSRLPARRRRMLPRLRWVPECRPCSSPE